MSAENSTPRMVFDWLIRHIRDNRLKRGDRLPKELDLSRDLGASRASVREAITLLKAFGIVKSRTSVGLTLTADPRQLDLIVLFLHQEIDGKTFREIKQLRDFIELGSAHLMVRNAKTEDLAVLRRLLREVAVGDGTGISPLEFEVAFHERLAMLSGNALAVALSLFYRPLFKYHIENHPLLKDNRAMPEYIIENHRRMVDALEARDFDRLLAEMRRQALHME